MNPNSKKYSINATLLAATLLATCLFTGSANAQGAFGSVNYPVLQGKFTLTYEIHWGQAVLPAGDYTLSLDAGSGKSAMAIIRNANTGRTVAVVTPLIREDGAEGPSALLIGQRGMQSVVHSFRVAELGLVFISDPELAHGGEVREEARRTKVVPVFIAQK